MTSPLVNDLRRYLEHSALKSTVGEAEIRKLCTEAISHNILAVVVNPLWVAFAKDCLRGSDVRLVSTCNFPLGASKMPVAMSEAMKAIEDGANEIDLVAPIGKLCAGQFVSAEDDLNSFRSRLPSTVALKVIIEAAVLSDAQIVEATKIVIDSGAEFVKTGTGFVGPATVEQVRLIASVVQGKIGIKAAGGIRTREAAISLIEAGANRIGSSHAIAILSST